MIRRRTPIRRARLPNATVEKVRAWETKQRESAQAHPIPQIGPKAIRELPDLDRFREMLRARHGGDCEAWKLYAADRRSGRVRPVCGTTAKHPGLHAHHVFPEDRDRGVHDPARGLFLCVVAHSWAHSEPDLAADLGLLRPDPEVLAALISGAIPS